MPTSWSRGTDLPMHLPMGRSTLSTATIVVRALAAALAAALALTGCGALRAAVAPPGARPGVDVPRERGAIAAAPLGSPALAPAGEGGYAFTLTHEDGSPVTFDPCRQIHLVVRPDNEPQGGRALLMDVLAEVSAATGLQFVDDGATDEAPSETRPAYQPERYGDRWAPVLVAWASPADTALLAGGGGGTVLGRAGPDTFGAGDDVRYVSGLAVFNGPALDAQLRHGEDEKARAVMLHELGHLVGLAHVPDSFQVMYDTNLWPLSRYRAGDLRGLEQLGLGRCYRSP